MGEDSHWMIVAREAGARNVVGRRPPFRALGRAPTGSLLRAGQLLAELHAPLVKRVDAPDDALDEYLVLVQRDQLAERFGCQST